MSEPLGPLNVDCDAPPYFIVQATRRIGLHAPEDVRWCRLSRFVTAPLTWSSLLKPSGWKYLLGLAPRPRADACGCGRPLPALKRYAFTSNNGSERTYLLGQCPGCHTVFWDPASATGTLRESRP